MVRPKRVEADAQRQRGAGGERAEAERSGRRDHLQDAWPRFYAKTDVERAPRKSTKRPGPNAPFANEIARLVSENRCSPVGRQALEPALCQLGALAMEPNASHDI